jgi:alkanesulfonate monooxygenase SsuD/methylene tetrahydromethanopterin reductase-like flavin-dependent oxidoreductase (luciferase family)
MHYAIYLPNFGPYGEARALAELARDAEQAGWDGFFLWDHVAGWDHPVVDPWVALTAVALATQRVRFGTTVTPLPRRRPWKVARETVSLDRLSGGRLTLSVGTGLGAEEWEDLGEEADPRVRGAMLDEALTVLTGLWRGERFSHQGQYYHLKEAHFQPMPLQSPRIPVWVGGFWPNHAPFRRAARWDGVFPLFETDGDEAATAQLREVVQYVAAQRTGGQPFDVVCTGVTPGADRAEAARIVAQYAEAGANWWLEGIAPYRFGRGFEGEWPVAALRERVLQGPPSAD